MNLVEFYAKTPVERHQDIVISADRLFFDGEEYIIAGDGELKIVRSQKGIESHLAQISSKLGIIPQ